MWFYYKGITRRVLIIIISAERQREGGGEVSGDARHTRIGAGWKPEMTTVS